MVVSAKSAEQTVLIVGSIIIM